FVERHPHRIIEVLEAAVLGYRMRMGDGGNDLEPLPHELAGERGYVAVGLAKAGAIPAVGACEIDEGAGFERVDQQAPPMKKPPRRTAWCESVRSGLEPSASILRRQRRNRS